MVLRDAIGKLSAAELFSSRTAVPKVKQAMEKSLSGKVFMRKAGRSTRNKIKQVHRTWKGFFHSEVKEGNQYHISETISPESAMPPRGKSITMHIPVYARYLALSTEGWLGPYAVKNTIRGFVRQVFGIWRRETLQTATPDVRQQVLAYVDSEDLEEIAPLSTDAREKFYLSATDFKIMACGIFEDTEGFRTARMMLQVLYALLLQSLSSEHPGAIIESSSHFGTNEALMWRDHEFHVLPNPDDPHSPIILIRIKIHLLKGYRKNNATYKEFLLMPETHSRALCPVSLIVAMAIEDNIFPHIKTANDIFHPKNPPTAHHILSMYPEAANTPALRSEIFDGGAWITSPTRALTYTVLSSHLRRVSINKGFIRHVTCYCCRRGASNRISREMTEQDRRTLMGHTEGSTKFDTFYKSRFIGADLGAVFQDRDENVEYVKAGKALMDMSARRDENAPKGLTSEGKAQLLAEPELVEMDNERKELANRITSLSKQLTCPDITIETRAEIEEQLILLKSDKKKIITKRHNAIRREEVTRIAERRTEFFDEQSARQLAGQSTSVTILPITKGKENATSSFIAERRKAPSAKAAVRNKALCDFAHDVFETDTTATTRSDSIVEFAGKYLALTKLPRTKRIVCYPGEDLSEDNNCAICDKQSSAMQQIGKHLHVCLAKQKLAEAQVAANDNFVPNPCLWKGCYASDTIWQSRQDYVAHIYQHMKMLILAGPKRGRCLWVDDDLVCDKKDDDYSYEDWAIHFAQEHGFNVRTNISIDHCAPCGQWFEDDLGDQSTWEEHCLFHYEDQFSAFQERKGDKVDLSVRGVGIYDNVAQYDPTEDLGGNHPELHGYIEQGVAVVPFYYPFCVFDDTLTLPTRMFQFRDNGTYARHLFHQHLHQLDKTQQAMCPVPSCGTHQFTFFDLTYHLVAFHRLPIMGTLRYAPNQNVRKLLLPVLDNDGQLVINQAQSQPKKATKSKSRTKPSPKAKKSHDSESDEQPGPSAPKVVAHRYRCAGCRNPLKDIYKHLSTSKLDSLCRKKARYVPISMDGKPVGKEEFFDFDLVDPSLAGTSKKKGLDHYCEIHSKQFTDIREHIPKHCSAEFFRIKGKHRHARDGTRHRFADWLQKNHPPPDERPLALQTVQESTRILGEMATVLPQELQDAMEIALNDTIMIATKALDTQL